jgi:hypothetical protein
MKPNAGVARGDSRPGSRHLAGGGRARAALDGAIRAGAAAYDRARDLPALVRLDPSSEIADTAEAVGTIVARLERALRAERSRARSGHWTYDLNRHIALHQAYLAETQRLAAIRAGRT